MKTLHLLIIVTATIVSLVAFGTYVIVHPLFGGIAPSPTFKGYIQIDTPGLEKTYKIGQPINFSVLIQGFALYPCQSPQIAIYNNDQTKPVFYYTTQSVSCPDSSEHYIFYFPSQNNTFSTMINKTGNYTVKVSIGQDSYQKQFSVTAYDITGIYDTGVEKNDTSSFRAYSALDPTSHCLMKYWPQDGRQRIEDPCISQPYRSIDGVSYNPGLTIIRAPTTGALPKLDLDVDDQGYLVVEPSIWTENKNGVVGIGRDVSKDEILQSSKILLNYCKNQMTWLALPVELQTGGMLIDMTCKNDHLDAVYTNIDYPYQSARVDVTFCNCTKTPKELGPWITSENGQLWTIGNTSIYVSGTALQTDDNKIDPRYSEYNFRFIKNGYKVFFTDMGSFDDSAKEVLRDFFDDKNISDLTRTQ